MPARRPVPALLALSLGYFTFGTSSLAVVGLSAPISEELHVQPASVGVLVSVFALTFAVAAPLAPAALRMLSRNHALLAGLGLMTIGGALSAAAPTYDVLIIGRVVGALGAAAYAPGASAAGSLIVPEQRRGRALATVFAGMTVAAVLGVPLASFLGSTVGWRWALGGVAGLTVLALALVWLLLPLVEQGERATVAAWRLAITTPGTKAIVTTTLLYMAGQFTVYGVASAYVAARSAASASGVAVVLFVFGVLGVIGNAAGAPIYERLGGARTITLALAGIAVAFAGLSIVPDSVVAVTSLFAFWAFFSQMYQAPQQARLVTLLPAQRGILLALNASTMYLGVSAGGLLGGVLLPHVDAQLLSAVGLLPLALAGAAHAASLRRRAAEPVGSAVSAS